MPGKKSDTSSGPECCDPCGPDMGGRCCSVEAVINVDERGQMVLPKDIREKTGIGPGDKLTLMTCSGGDRVPVIVLIRSKDFTDMVNDFVGPILGGPAEK